MSFVTDEDDDFGPPNLNSKLSSLFRDSLNLPSDNKTLTYIAPKRPNGNQQSQQVKHVSPSTDQEILAAAAVTCYKLNNEKYEAIQGKVGLALLGNHEKCSYSIVLYLNKQKPISTTRITKDFKLTILPDNFCTFYDDSRQNWATLFDSNDVSQKFVSEIDKILALLGASPVPIPKESPKETVVQKNTENLPDNYAADAKESSKTKLISRMAKLGQPILPLKGAAVAEDSDSDTTIPSSTETEQESAKPKKPSRPDKPSLQTPQLQPLNENTLVNPIVFPTSHYSFMNGQHSVPTIPYLAPSLPYSGPTAGGYANYYETLLSETRTQNSEIRMHLCRLMDKIDHLAQRQEKPLSDMTEFKLNFNKLLGQSSQQTEQLTDLLSRVTIADSQSAQSSGIIQKETERGQLNEDLCTEGDSLKLTIKTLREENNQLASLVDVKVEEHRAALQKIEQLQNENLKLSGGLNDKLYEQKETLEKVHQEKIESLKVLINELKAKEENFTSQQESALRDVQAKEKSNQDLVNELRNSLEDKNRQLDLARQETTRAKEELRQTNRQIAGLNEDLSRVKTELSKRTAQGSQASVTDQVKTIMNKIYKEITKQFSPEETYSFKDIKSTVGAVIRDTTLKLLNDESDVIQEPHTIQVQTPRKIEVQGPTEYSKEEVTRDDPDEESTLDDKGPQSETPHQLEETLAKDPPLATTVIKPVVEKPEGEIKEETAQFSSDHSKEEDETNAPLADNNEEMRERSESFEETLKTSLAAANSRYNQGEPTWKPDPPPLPPLRDFDDDEDDWLS